MTEIPSDGPRGLSAAAQAALDELDADLRRLVVARAAAKSPTRESAPITAIEVLEAWEETVRTRGVARSRADVLSRAYVLLGALVAGASVLVVLLINVGASSPASVLVGAAGLAGIATAILGLTVAYQRELRGQPIRLG